MSSPSWKDLQQLGCSEIGRIIRGPYITRAPVCRKCKQQYYWSNLTDEWVHPFEKEFEEFERLKKLEDLLDGE